MHSALACLLLPLFVLLPAVAVQLDSISFTASEQPVELTDASSSEVVLLSRMRSATDCLLQCSARNCDAVASSSGKSGICELLFINDASKQLGPPGTHVARRFGNSSTGELQVWKVADFEQ
uniref:Apple domain-containing protein n=1 Tax=Macrostomum lignano TaxID=282301 RepID=A0A1I8H5D1_9PLAT